ncbi:MAG: hypothetical protein CMN28_15215 [Salinisphaeraceae bacterium]|nr:hypothetical protein [Salinisphaeraceae bacterium]
MAPENWQGLSDGDPYHDHAHHDPDREAGPSPESPRYSERPLPRYRYLPGRDPHPVDDDEGHGLDAPAIVQARAFSEVLADWRYAIDLFNHGYWWEAGRYFSALRHARGAPDSIEILRLAADTLLKRRMGWRSAVAQGRSAILKAGARMPGDAPNIVDFIAWTEALDRCLRPGGNDFPRLRIRA